MYAFLYIKRTIKRGGAEKKLKEVGGDRRKKGVTHVLWPMRKFASIFFSNITLHKKILRYMSTAILHYIKKY